MVVKSSLVTGGTGMVGSAFRQLHPEFDYPTRHQLAVICGSEFKKYHFKDKTIIHLAAKVGGVKANMEQMSDFYLENAKLNQAVLSSAALGGAKKVISLLSTCIYPDEPYITYPLTEEQLHLGPPHHSNFGYAYAKRMIDVMSRAYRQQYGCNFITAIPNNLYGENDNFDLENSHVIPALIRKVWEAKLENKPYIECWGDGSPLREFTYSEDIVKILMFLVEKYDKPEPINIGNTSEYSIKSVLQLICKILEYKGEVVYNTDKPKGQYRKPTSNQKLLDLGWKKKDYTSLEQGLEKTCSWFVQNYPNIRGIS